MKTYIIFSGTDPHSERGGIGFVMKGYFAALKAAGVPFDCIPTYHPAKPGGKWIPWIKAFPRLNQSVRRLRDQGFQPVVYSHMGAGLSLLRESCILWAACLAGARTMSQIHAAQVDKYLNKTIPRWLFKAALRPADIVCLLTRWWKERLEEAGIGGRLKVIPNPLSPDLEKVAKQIKAKSRLNGSEDGSVTVLTMTRLVSGKGVDIAVKAVAKLPERVHLIVAGDGDQRGELEKTVRDLGVDDRIRFVGWVAGKEKVKLLEEADIFCLPSTSDTFPVSMVEAMAYGLPVVAVKWAGIPDMVANGRAGILTELPDEDQIAAAIEELMDKERRYEMGAEAKRWILEISSANRVGHELAEVVQELCS